MTNGLIQHITVKESTSIQWVKVKIWNEGMTVVQGSKGEETKVVSLCEMVGNNVRMTQPFNASVLICLWI